MYNDRLSAVTSYMKSQNLPQIIVTSTPAIFYLTGLYIDPMERMLALLIKGDGEATLFANILFAIDPDTCPFPLVLHKDSDNPVSDLCKALLPGTVGIDKNWPSRFLLSLLSLRNDLLPCIGSAPVDLARMQKDETELELLRNASCVNDGAMESAIKFLKEGVSEAEVASFLSETYLSLGADFPIGILLVCFGENASDPHHIPSAAKLKAGDSVVLDIFTPVNRYFCDMTRTVFFKEASKKQIEVYETVRRANLAATELIRPGIPLSLIDKTARDIIKDAGYGEFFTHRLGHGLGIECHEPPDLSPTSEAVAIEGMVFSVEPGIYLPGEFGVRIENLVHVTKTGVEVLNKLPTELIIIE